MDAVPLEGLHELLGDTFTYGEARRVGLSDRRLYGLRDAGKVIALGGGVYRWADAPPADDDLVEIAERVPLATLCLETALARHGLIDAIPAAIDIAVPRGSTRPALRAPCRLHQFDARTFDLEREHSTSAPGGLWACTARNARSSTLSGCVTEKAATWRGRLCGVGWTSRGRAPRGLLNWPSGSLMPSPRCREALAVLL